MYAIFENVNNTLLYENASLSAIEIYSVFMCAGVQFLLRHHHIDDFSWIASTPRPPVSVLLHSIQLIDIGHACQLIVLAKNRTLLFGASNYLCCHFKLRRVIYPGVLPHCRKPFYYCFLSNQSHRNGGL